MEINANLSNFALSTNICQRMENISSAIVSNQSTALNWSSFMRRIFGSIKSFYPSNLKCSFLQLKFVFLHFNWYDPWNLKCSFISLLLGNKEYFMCVFANDIDSSSDDLRMICSCNNSNNSIYGWKNILNAFQHFDSWIFLSNDIFIHLNNL